MSRDTREVCPATSHGMPRRVFAPKEPGEPGAVGPSCSVVVRRCRSHAMEQRGEMELQRLSHCGHPHLVAQRVSVHRDVTLDCGDSLRCRGSRHRHRTQADRSFRSVVVERALLYLDDAGRVGEHKFHNAKLRHPPVASFSVQRTAVVCRRRALVVREKWLADMTERDGFVVVERCDRRVDTAARACPRSEQELQWLDVRVQRCRCRSGSCSGHITSVGPRLRYRRLRDAEGFAGVAGLDLRSERPAVCPGDVVRTPRREAALEDAERRLGALFSSSREHSELVTMSVLHVAVRSAILRRSRIS
jgi:hypothetical protein